MKLLPCDPNYKPIPEHIFRLSYPQSQLDAWEAIRMRCRMDVFTARETGALAFHRWRCQQGLQP